jgi:hypothetical protein
MHKDYTPPAPGTTGASTKSREFENKIPPTAGATDPLAVEHANLNVQKTRSDFKPEEFVRTIQQHGKRIVWRKAMVCPCIQPTTGQARVDCPNCDTSGFIYVDNMDIRALMLAFEKSTRIYEKFGLWVSGEVAVTVEHVYRLGYRDSLEMIDEMMNFNEVIQKGDRHGRRSVLENGIDTARYRIQNLTKVVTCDSSNNIVALDVGYHLEVNEHGQIVWRAPGKKIVNDGQFISLHYDFHPVYIVISHPHVIRSDMRGTKVPNETVTPLPLQVGAQLDFLSNENPNVRLPVTGDC